VAETNGGIPSCEIGSQWLRFEVSHWFTQNREQNQGIGEELKVILLCDFSLRE
jgi:hypothetical protein